ncbi:MAG: hypothetical protein A2017_15885 [Lentisphaerae bacterium GWF2_44_16]|nr:MAG: hypothetical protein A2017_15885 [Lentisphaerae bacterium GWF2_44_16]
MIHLLFKNNHSDMTNSFPENLYLSFSPVFTLTRKWKMKNTKEKNCGKIINIPKAVLLSENYHLIRCSR